MRSGILVELVSIILSSVTPGRGRISLLYVVIREVRARASATSASANLRRALRAGMGREVSLGMRGVLTLAVLTISVFAAQGIGLVDLIGKGYRLISWVLIAIFILPILFVSIARPRYLTQPVPLRAPPG